MNEPRMLRYERTDYGKAIRKQYESGEIQEKIGNMRRPVPRPDYLSNTLTGVLKDNLLLVPNGWSKKDNYTNEWVRGEPSGMKFLDLFSGIGGFRLGMEQAGHECVGFVEWDKFARKSYESIHDTEGEWTANDITTVTDNDLGFLRGKGIDVICGGFPCQSFSVAGKRGGFADTRGTMFFEIARFAKQIKPRLLLLENVKGLLSHDKGNTFGTILNTLDELGYDTEWQVLNSKNFGVPQNRERVFIVGHLRGASTREIFPVRGDYEALGVEVLGTTAPPERSVGQKDRVYSIEGLMSCLTATDYKQPKQIMVVGNLEMDNWYRAMKEVLDPNGISTCLDTMQGGHKQPKILIKEATKKGYAEATIGDSINFSVPGSETRRGRVGKGVANTLDTSCNQGTLVPIGAVKCLNTWREDGTQTRMQDRIYDPNGLSVALTSFAGRLNTLDNYRIRKLTPRECFRLQSFPDWAFDKAAEVNSDSQLYKQAGNSVTVNVIYEIAKRLGV